MASWQENHWSTLPRGALDLNKLVSVRDDIPRNGMTEYPLTKLCAGNETRHGGTRVASSARPRSLLHYSHIIFGTYTRRASQDSSYEISKVWLTSSGIFIVRSTRSGTAINPSFPHYTSFHQQGNEYPVQLPPIPSHPHRAIAWRPRDQTPTTSRPLLVSEAAPHQRGCAAGEAVVTSLQPMTSPVHNVCVPPATIS